MECKIFLASLTAHNKGMVDGEWIDLKDNKAKDKIKAFMDAREGHEFLIANSIASLPLDISEYDNPFKLVALVERLKNLDETQLEAYETIMYELGWSREDALDKAENWEFDAIDYNCTSIEKSVGYYYAELIEYTNMADSTISKYFDYERYGRDICEDNYICDNGRTIFVIFN